MVVFYYGGGGDNFNIDGDDDYANLPITTILMMF